MLIELHNVSKFYGTRLILKDISLTVDAGCISLLIGANGAGKSTLMQMMVGLCRPNMGSVERHVDDFALAYLGHSSFLYSALSAWENLDFWAKLYKVKSSDKVIANVLEQVNLSGFAHEKVSIFSRGMAQRLSLARVLLLEPMLLFLDEPATGLDTSSVKILHKEIIAAKNRGAGIVWISHDLRTDVGVADRILEIGDKVITYDGLASAYVFDAN